MKKIFIMGDIHGDYKPIELFHLRNKDDNAYNRAEKIIILLGDAGFNFYFDYRDEKIKKKLKEYPFTYFVIRGNHEERPSICAKNHPNNWHKDEYFGNKVWIENDYPYIKYAMDNVCPYDINGYSTIVIPGAYSVDKDFRLKNYPKTWFINEQLSWWEMGTGLKTLYVMNWKCDLVLSHTCPYSYMPVDLFIPTINQSEIDNTMEKYLNQIENMLDYRLWCFGHYHSTRAYPKYQNSQMIMLFNEKVIELSDWLNHIEKFY